jgi:hypothetical protein
MDYTFSDREATEATSLEEVIAARPEYLFQNHGHVDQMRHGADIPVRAGSKLVGSIRHCEYAKHSAMVKGLKADKVQCDLVRDSQGRPFTGFDSFFYYGDSPTALGFTRFGEMGRPDEMAPELDVTVVHIKHSAPRPWPDDLNPCLECYQPGEIVAPPVDYVAGGPSPRSLWVNTADFSGDDGGNLMYIVRYGDFTLVHHGSTSSLNKLEPGQADVRSALERVGAEDIDVEIGGIGETQNIAQGSVDSRRYTELIKPKLFFPQHHTLWGLPFGQAKPRHFYGSFMTEMQKIDPKIRPDICFVVEDQMHTAWSFKTSEWAGNSKGTATPIGGPNCYTGS